MALPTRSKHWRWIQNFKTLSLLIAIITTQGLPVLCLAHTQDWTVCSQHVSGPVITAQDGERICPLASDWSPWSRQPLCSEPVEDDDDMVGPDCVFTLEAFRGHQGISLITTPDLAASLTEYLDDSHLSPDLRHQLASSERRQQNGSAAYEIKSLQGRGKGVVAKRGFAKHATVMVGFPVLVIRLDFINGERYTQRQKRLMMEASVGNLPPEQQDSIKALARSTGGEPILDTLRTNGFGIEIEGVQHLALFIDGSVSTQPCTSPIP